MHANPVKRELMQDPDQWRWSSYRTYALGEEGAVKLNQHGIAEIKLRTPTA
jgi:hypothetical protein